MAYTNGMNRNSLLIGGVIIIIAVLILSYTRAQQATAPSSEEETTSQNRNTGSTAGTNEANTNGGTILTAELRAIAKTRDEKRLADIRSLQAGLEAFKDEHPDGFYPNELSELVPKYIASIPNDPKTDEPYSYTPIGSGPNYYDLVYTLEVGVEDVVAGEHTATPEGISAE